MMGWLDDYASPQSFDFFEVFAGAQALTRVMPFGRVVVPHLICITPDMGTMIYIYIYICMYNACILCYNILYI